MPFHGQIGEAVEVSPHLPDAAPQERMSVLYRDLARRVASADMPAVIAGDCIAAIGILAGLQRRGLDPTLLWFDAHGDFHTWETTASGFLGGMPLAMLTGRGEQTIVTGAGLDPIPDEQVVLIGARDLDPGEDAAVAASGMLTVGVEDLSLLDLPGPLYVHVDVDVIDPVDLPAVDYPAPGGPSLDAVRDAMEDLASTGRVVAFSISSWNPDLPEADRAAAASLSLAALFERRGG